MPALDNIDDKYCEFNLDEMIELGRKYHDEYINNKPFPHIAIDDFMNPNVLDACNTDFPRTLDVDGKTFQRAQENLKSSFNPDFLPHTLRSMFYSFNARPFIAFLEELTGIRGLIPDPYFLGGGFHETLNGGHLSVHADFNHHKLLNLERRINALIYLNKDWKDEYGGHLELWDASMKHRVKSIAPIFNRLVVFNTTATSFHGQPDAISHPQGKSRRSIALYYYTATWDDTKRDRTTQFKSRPNSMDKIDFNVKIWEGIAEFVPPILFRKLRHLFK